MSLFSNLYVGSSGLRTSQNALNTTAHNMANIGTNAYTRQQVTQGTMEYNTIKVDYNMNGPMQNGLGVVYNNTKQVRDIFLDKSYRLEGGRSAFYEVSYNTMKEIEDQLQELNGAEFADTYNNLWTAIQELSKDPTDATYQAQFVNRANEFLVRGKAVYKGFQDYQNRMNNNVADIVSKINAYGDELLELNKAISRIEGGGVEHANDLRDRRNEILDELSKYVDIEYQEDPLRVVTVSIEGTAFVMTDSVHHIGLDTSDSCDHFYTPYWEFAAKEDQRQATDQYGNLQWIPPGDPTGTPVMEKYLNIDGAKVIDLRLQVSSAMRTDVGSLRSTLLARGDHYANYHDIKDDASNAFYNENIAQSIIMNMEAEFDMLFHNTCMAINEVMRNAQSNPATISGEGDTADWILFEVADPTLGLGYKIDDEHLAGLNRMGLSVTNTVINDKLQKDPTLFSFRTLTGDHDEAAIAAMKEAFSAENYVLNPNVATRNSLRGYYNALCTQVATSGSIYKGIMEFQELTVDGIASAREEVHGVNQDEELQFMIQFQNAFNASSRYINVVSEMLDHLLNSLA
ncbi:MAG: flagellar hook-associated protein FlgK [Lachnospiraceae bacterium]|nr:flagellar hook-associated protein FlgK [Lachnospiraceae bacterium]